MAPPVPHPSFGHDVRRVRLRPAAIDWGHQLVEPFNALNNRDRTGADSADWADEPTDDSLLSGFQPSTRTNSITFAKVRVAGSNPVVRSKSLSCSAALFTAAWRTAVWPLRPWLAHGSAVPLGDDWIVATTRP